MCDPNISYAATNFNFDSIFLLSDVCLWDYWLTFLSKFVLSYYNHLCLSCKIFMRRNKRGREKEGVAIVREIITKFAGWKSQQVFVTMCVCVCMFGPNLSSKKKQYTLIWYTSCTGIHNMLFMPSNRATWLYIRLLYSM